jgi:hypothetical protein
MFDHGKPVYKGLWLFSSPHRALRVRTRRRYGGTREVENCHPPPADPGEYHEFPNQWNERLQTIITPRVPDEALMMSDRKD